MFDRTIGLDPRPAAPQSRTYLPHAGRPSPRIRREPGPRVHLLQRTVPWGARRHRHLRRRLRPRSRRGPLRRPSLHHAAGRERLDTRRARPRNPSHRTQRQPVQGADPHAQRRGRGPEAGRRAGNRSRPGDRVRSYPARRSRTRHRHLSGLPPGAPTPDRAGGHRPPCAARRRVQERRSTQERVRACERRPPGCRRRAAPRGRGARLAGRCPRPRALPGRADRVHRLRGTKRTRQHRGRVRQLPGSLHTCQGGRRVPDARQRPGRRAPALRSLGVGDGGDRSSLRGPSERDPAALEL